MDLIFNGVETSFMEWIGLRVADECVKHENTSAVLLNKLEFFKLVSFLAGTKTVQLAITHEYLYLCLLLLSWTLDFGLSRACQLMFGLRSSLCV